MASDPPSSGRQRRGRATITDVATAAGVSRQTVSNVLNSPDRVAGATREKVDSAIAALGYSPHVAAQKLRRRAGTAYGFEVNSSGVSRMGHVLDEFLVELTRSAPEHRHVVTFASDPEDVLSGYARVLASGLVDGFVIADTRLDDPRPAWLREQGVPFVAFGRIWDDPSAGPWVDVDGRAGMQAAVEHLLAQGYGSIAYLGWPAGSPVGDDRRRGWLSALAVAGLADHLLAEESAQDLEDATAAADRLLDRLGDTGAIVCASDLLALATARAVRTRGLTPGEDIGIVGMDDSDVAEALSLTSIRQPLGEAAREAWQILTLADSPGLDPDPHSELTRLLAPALTIRGTTGGPATTSRPRGIPTL